MYHFSNINNFRRIYSPQNVFVLSVAGETISQAIRIQYSQKKREAKASLFFTNRV